MSINAIKYSIFTAVDSLKLASRELNPAQYQDIIKAIETAITHADKALEMLCNLQRIWLLYPVRLIRR